MILIESYIKRFWVIKNSSYYRNNRVSYLNYKLWLEILKDDSINNNYIDLNDFCNFCKFYITFQKSKILFGRINIKSNIIYFADFNNFLNLLYDEDYSNIISSLIFENNQNTKIYISKLDSLHEYSISLSNSTDDLEYQLVNKSDDSESLDDSEVSEESESLDDSQSLEESVNLEKLDSLNLSKNSIISVNMFTQIYNYISNYTNYLNYKK